MCFARAPRVLSLVNKIRLPNIKRLVNALTFREPISQLEADAHQESHLMVAVVFQFAPRAFLEISQSLARFPIASRRRCISVCTRPFRSSTR
jgi:hypothetical protein